MIGALLGRGLRHHRGLLLALGGGTLLFETLIVWFSAQFDRGPGLGQLIEQFLPQQLRLLLASQLEMASFAGFVGFGFQHPFTLVSTIALMLVLATVPAAERESGFLDLVLSRPLTRERYVAAVLLTMLCGALLLPLTLLAGAALGLALVEAESELPWTRYATSAARLAALLLAVGGYTLLFAAGARRRGVAVARAAGLTLALFVLDVFADVWAPLQRVSWLSPFHYYEPLRAAVLRNEPVWHPLLLLGVFVATAGAALARFRRQDL